MINHEPLLVHHLLLAFFKVGSSGIVRLECIIKHVVSLILLVIGIMGVSWLIQHIEAIGRINGRDHAHFLGSLNLIFLHISYLTVAVNNHFLKEKERDECKESALTNTPIGILNE